jgi:hypothetical protein
MLNSHGALRIPLIVQEHQPEVESKEVVKLSFTSVVIAIPAHTDRAAQERLDEHR